MNLAISYGLVCAFFAIVIATLYVAKTRVKDRGFTDYAVAGRSFGGFYQAMSFVNTWWPGTVFISFAGLAAGAGVIGFYGLSYSMLTVVVMYLMARRVWLWGERFGLHTQSELFGFRYDSRAARTVSSVIGIIAQFPWIVLGMQAMGLVFYYLSFGHLTFTEAVIVGVVFVAIRQIWTIQMGMRGVVLTDMVQGIVSYFIGAMLIVALIGWLVVSGHGFGPLPSQFFTLPGLGSSTGPLYLFALVFTGALGGWCWPAIFVRLFTAKGVGSLKRSAAIGVPISGAFYALLVIFAIFAASYHGVAKNPDNVWFVVTNSLGPWILALAGIVVFAATMGNVDGNLQANGAQFANDLVADYRPISDARKTVVAKLAILVLTVLAAFVASFNLTGLVTLAIIAYQGIIQLAVAQFMGLFWRRGNKQGAVAGMIGGFITAAVMQWLYPTSVPWLAGLTSGMAGLIVNFVLYVACSYLFGQPPAERARVRQLFTSTRLPALEGERVRAAGRAGPAGR